MTLDVEQGESVLLISPVSVPQQELQRLQDRVTSKGKVQYVRHTDLSVSGFPSGSFDSIVAIGGSFDHTKQFFAKIATLLKPSGKFFLTEPILQSNQPKPGLRTQEDLKGELLLSGFVDTVTKLLNEDSRAEILTVQFISRKHAYEVGASQSLRTRKAVAPAPAPSVWSIDEDDAMEDAPDVQATPDTWMISDDQTLDEDLLLEDIDKQVVTVLPDNDDCENTGGRKGACKNCTCGRAEMTEEQVQTTKSSCGNCYLGDAFRCSTCPFLGQPAFKPGERVVLSNN